ncbi:hypothetical protein BH23THE1_BH23THE1_19220 [soil metagenome]
MDASTGNTIAQEKKTADIPSFDDLSAVTENNMTLISNFPTSTILNDEGYGEE